MDQPNIRLRDFYLNELDALRDDGVEFAHSHPDVAKELGMGKSHWRDPQAEMLVQSFAFLSARIRNQMEQDRCAIPNALLNHLYPHMQAPLPSMTVVKAQASLQTADGRSVERGRIFSVEAEAAKRTMLCRFSNCYDTPIWPLTATDIDSISVKELDFVDPDSEINGVLRIALRTDAKNPIQDLPLAEKGLRFYLNGGHELSGHLYELLSTSLVKIAVDIPGEGLRFLDKTALQWLGFADDEAALPDSEDSNPGYRLLREYFTFPQKFLFCDVKGLPLTGADRAFNLYFLFTDPISETVDLTSDCMQLNCMPLVNLFSQSIEPIRLTGRQYEYPVESDRLNVANSEVYQITSLHSVVNGEAPQPISPCYELSEFDGEDDASYFYSFRRELSESERIAGTRMFVSLLDMNMDVCDVPAEAIGGTALCTNRRLPEKLHEGSRLNLEGAGPVTGARLVSKVSEYGIPKITGNAPWQLVSQLSLNFLSITGGDKGLDAFKSILRVYTDPKNLLVWKQINSLKSISSQRVARVVKDTKSQGVTQGLQIRLKINESDFRGISPVLFASVCRYFFVLYASLGTFVELVLESNKDRGDWKTWPPMAGALVDL